MPEAPTASKEIHRGTDDFIDLVAYADAEKTTRKDLTGLEMVYEVRPENAKESSLILSSSSGDGVDGWVEYLDAAQGVVRIHLYASFTSRMDLTQHWHKADLVMSAKSRKRLFFGYLVPKGF